MPHSDHRYPASRQAAGRLSAITRYGCTGCHTIGGEGSNGPDLSAEHQLGPNLSHIAAKDSKEWVVKWIANPHAFRPDSRMPRFYGLTNNGTKEDWPKNYAEIHAITHYLFTRARRRRIHRATGQDRRGQWQRAVPAEGCLACHQHRPYAEADIQQQDRRSMNPAYKPDPALTFDPKTFLASADPKSFVASVQQNALADFGPNLSNIAAKFQGKPRPQMVGELDPGTRAIPPQELDAQPSALGARSRRHRELDPLRAREWPVTMDVPGVDTKEVKDAVDDIVKLYVSKSGSFKTADGKSVAKSLSEVDDYVTKELKSEDKLLYLGEKTISRLGCFGCHTIPGFENAKRSALP